MPKTKKKIVIIENLGTDFQALSESLVEKLGAWFEVFPKWEEQEETPGNFYFMKERFIEPGKFGEILDHYADADFFVVDIYLDDKAQGGGDTGWDFIRQLKERRPQIGNCYAIISTLKDDDRNIIWKGVDWQMTVVQRVLDAFPEVARERDLLLEIQPHQNYARRLLKIYREDGLVSAMSNFFASVNKIIRYMTHVLITLAFYFLIWLTAWYAITRLYGEFASARGLHFSGPVAHDQDVLDHVEKIFLYLLPIFIVFGFYIYYTTNTRIYFFNGQLDEKGRETSAHAMNFTKVILVSSLISFTLIETINAIFNERANTTELVAAGGLLLVLIFYFIIVSRHKRLEPPTR